MINTLKAKMQNKNAKYSDNEVLWLINHIGDPSSEIRDDLFCNSLGNGILDNKFSRHQVEFLVQTAIKRNLLFYKIDESEEATLTRTFACLLWNLIFLVTEDQNSEYFQVLNKNDEQKVIDDLISYLRTEHDFTGYSKEYGWVHAIAHCSDALEAAIKLIAFSNEQVKSFLEATFDMFNKVDRRFTDEEEYLLADVFITGFKVGKIDQDQFKDWLKKFTLNPEAGSILELHRFLNLKSFLEDIYVKLNSSDMLNDGLRKVIETDYMAVY